MVSQQARSRAVGEEDLERHQEESLATLQTTQSFHQKSRSNRFSRSTAIIVCLVVANLVLIAQCLGIWDPARWTPLSAGRKTDADEPIPLDSILPAARGEVGDLSIFTKRRGTTALTEPSVSCDLCPEGDDFCMELGYHNIARSVVYEGSNERVHAFLRKLEQGKPVSVGVIGGSVSSGHGLGRETNTNEKNGPYNMHRQVFDWITTKYPHPDHKFTNGALPATGSLYFATCFGEHIPEDVDIIFVELAVNDVRHVTVQIEYEQLLRGLLDLPNQPAIVNMQVFGLLFDPISQGGDQHLGVANYYDTPVVSTRSLLLPMIFEDYREAEVFFSVDPKKPGAAWHDRVDERHFGWRGHSAMSNLTRIYLERQLCKMHALASLEEQGFAPRKSSLKWPSRRIIKEVPKMLLTNKYNRNNFVPKLQPQCLSTISEKHPLVPSESFGWTFWNWKEKRYLVGRVPGSKMSIPFKATLGDVKVYYQRSAKYGLGQADCWVDDDVKGKVRLDGYWKNDYSIVVSTMIRKEIPPGRHVLHCEVAEETSDTLSNGHEFRITSLTAL